MGEPTEQQSLTCEEEAFSPLQESQPLLTCQQLSYTVNSVSHTGQEANVTAPKVNLTTVSASQEKQCFSGVLVSSLVKRVAWREQTSLKAQEPPHQDGSSNGGPRPRATSLGAASLSRSLVVRHVHVPAKQAPAGERGEELPAGAVMKGPTTPLGGDGDGSSGARARPHAVPGGGRGH